MWNTIHIPSTISSIFAHFSANSSWFKLFLADSVGSVQNYSYLILFSNHSANFKFNWTAKKNSWKFLQLWGRWIWKQYFSNQLKPTIPLGSINSYFLINFQFSFRKLALFQQCTNKDAHCIFHMLSWFIAQWLMMFLCDVTNLLTTTSCLNHVHF